MAPVICTVCGTDDVGPAVGALAIPGVGVHGRWGAGSHSSRPVGGAQGERECTGLSLPLPGRVPRAPRGVALSALWGAVPWCFAAQPCWLPVLLMGYWSIIFFQIHYLNDLLLIDPRKDFTSIPQSPINSSRVQMGTRSCHWGWKWRVYWLQYNVYFFRTEMAICWLAGPTACRLHGVAQRRDRSCSQCSSFAKSHRSRTRRAAST